MNDSSDGSSSAAQSAPPSNTEPGPEAASLPPQTGLIGRLRWAISPPQQSQPTKTNGQALAGAIPGMGNLRRMRVEDVAIPKVEIVAVPSDIEKDELVQVFRGSGLTRLPVYDGTLDSPLGMVHLKDLALGHGFNGDRSKEFELRPMLRPLIYAPPSMPIGVLLQKMQSQRMHMALVIDEYGGTDGLVTIEDLIEQVIGEIEDEHDQADDVFWQLEKPGCYLAFARTPLEEFEAELGMTLADPQDNEEIDTLGGLVFMLTGRVPVRGEVITHPQGVQFEIVDADPRRVKRLRVRMPSAQTAEKAEQKSGNDSTG